MKVPEVIGNGEYVHEDGSTRAIGDVIAMQLASITYCTINGGSVSKTLKKYLPNCQLVWEPVAAIDGNWAFMVLYGSQYIISIRGSILNFSWAAIENWFEDDFNIFVQKDWVYTNNPDAKPMISAGSLDGLNALTQLVDSNGDTMLQFLSRNAFPYRMLLAVTGHSLGANLATVFGSWLRYQLLQAGFSMPSIFSILTFAAPTSWNKAFATEYDTNLTNTWRYYNEMDIVPMSATNIAGIGLLYPPPAPYAVNIPMAAIDGIRMNLAKFFVGVQGLVDAAEQSYGSYYTHVNQNRGAVPLNTDKHVFPVDSGDSRIVQWLKESSDQHDHNNYLKWLCSGPLTCEKAT